MAEVQQESKSAFIGLTSTEIRSTLNTITGIHNLLQETSLTPEQQAYMTSVQESTGTLLTLINDLMDFSLIESGEFSFDVMQFDLRTAVEEAMEAIACRAVGQTTEIHTLIHASVPEQVRGDPARIRRIISNLVGNALEFSASGEVVLSVKTIEEDTEQTVVRFDINEFGAGLTNEQLQLLLEPFSQSDPESSWKYGRTGLGLALTKRLAQMMGGQIGLSMVAGKGSTFWFSVSLKKCPREYTALGGPQQSLDGMNILIADPSPSGRRIMVHYLETAGCNCREYDHGEDVLMELEYSKNASWSFDAILLAMQEVGEKGYQLAARLKAGRILAGIPLVLVTAIGKRGDARIMKDLGVAAYLTRPIKQAQLLECMRIIRRNGTAASEDSGTAGTDGGKRQLITRHTIAEKNTGRKFRVLVADDNAANRKAVRKILDKAGYGCEVTENGIDAVDSFGKKEYDLIFMDCEMPILNGYNAVRIIRQEEASRGGGHVPICGMIAGVGGDDEMKRCREAGMDDTLIKPLHQDTVIALVERWERTVRQSSAGVDKNGV